MRYVHVHVHVEPFGHDYTPTPHVYNQNVYVFLSINLILPRLAEVWMDKYKKIYYAGSPKVSDFLVSISLSV